MQTTMMEQIKMYQTKNRRRRTLKKCVQVLGCLVVFITTYALILPAITMEQKAFCGMEEHIHTDSCGQMQLVSVLDCTQEKLGIHIHHDECYDSQGDRICSQADYVAHAHDALCYDTNGQLVCTLPECTVHDHSEACYGFADVAPEVLHIHSDSCFRTEQGSLICELEESDDHGHEDSCYESNSALSCGMEEGQAEPTEPAEWILLCKEPIASVHQHNESCFRVSEQRTEALNCGMEEHTHNLVCYSDSEADVETEEVWKATFADVELKKDLTEDLLAIAESQIGYTESSRNYRVWDDNSIHGYTRYGDWYGDPYGEWSAMFVSFCLHYAQEELIPDDLDVNLQDADVEEIPYDADVSKWIEKLEEQELYRSAEESAAEKGNLIFFDTDKDGLADRVGIIAEVKEATEHTGASIEVIEGDSQKSVGNVSYRPEDDTIVGYFAPKDFMDSWAVKAPENDSDENETPVAENSDVNSVTAQIFTDGTYETLSGENVVITLSGAIPEDAYVKAFPVTLQTEMDILFAYDITIFRGDGSVFEPSDGEVVNVLIQSPVLETAEENLEVYHIPEEGDPDLVESDISDGEVSFDASHFSVYAVTKATNYIVSLSPNLSCTWTEVSYTASDSDYQTLCALKFNVSDNNWDAVTVTVSSNTFETYGNPAVHEIIGSDAKQILTEYQNNSVSFTVGGWELRNRTYAVLLTPPSRPSLVLEEDMVVSETMYATKDVTVDLNGYSIRTSPDFNGPIFKVMNGTLTIKDSAAPSESRKQTSLAALSAHTASTAVANDSVTLTYYVTDPQITNNGTGATTETVYEHTVTTSGVIMAGNGPAISVNGGTVNMESGMLYGDSARAIEANGNAKINLSGGYICGFRGDNGGAISINGGSLNISGTAVVAGNHAYTTGGAIYAYGCNISMSGGVVSGNTVATADDSNGGSGTDSGLGNYGGGGVAIKNCTMTLSGGYITNNHSLATGYWSGGGGIYSPGSSTITVSGGFVTGNMANAGGGIKTRDYGGGTDTFNMTGGYICSNKSTYGEGGGISIGGGDNGTITGGYINNNYADCRVDWGGGGIFVSNDAELQITNALVTENDAGGFGGGVAGCSTARMYLSRENGAAIYNNTASGENLSGAGSTKNADWTYAKNNPVFMANGYDDLFSALNCTVSGSMLGGGLANWQGSCDGIPVSSNSATDQIQSESMLGLTSHPNNDAQTAAQAAAIVYINGNYAYTHGGGILCNGYLVMGTTNKMVIGARIEIAAGKIYQDSEEAAVEIPDNQFKFEIADDQGNVVSTGTARTNGEIVFTGRLPFSGKGKYIYYVYEKPGVIQGIDYDPTQYQITVTAEEASMDNLMGGISRTQCKIDNIKVEILKPGTTQWKTISEFNPEDKEKDAIRLDLGTNTFRNVLREIPTETRVTVNKIWTDPTDTVPVTVTLLQNGNAYGQIQLSEGNNWTYTWENLPIASEGISYEYSVEEVALEEFDVSYSYGTSEEDGSPVVTITNTRRLYQLNLTKVSNHQTPRLLEGVKFRILNANDEPLYFIQNQEKVYIPSVSTAEGATPELITDIDGKICISGLRAGEYQVTETEALAGYQLADATLITLGGESMVENRTYSVTVVNKLIEYMLPKTGGAGTNHYITAGVVLILTALMLLYIPKYFRKEVR